MKFNIYFLFAIIFLISCNKQDPEISIKQGEWVEKASFPSDRRYGAFGFSLHDKIYLGGGHVQDFYGSFNPIFLLKDFWEYNPAIDKWTQKTDLPFTKVLHGASFTINGKGYIVAGVIGQVNIDTPIYSNNLWEYDPSIDHWTQKASFPGTPRLGAIGFSIGQKGYLTLGGYIEDQRLGEYSYPTDLWEYDPSIDHWTQKASFPADGSKFSLGLSSSKYGFAISGDSYTKNECWRYDPSTDEWKKLKDFEGKPSSFTTGFVINDRLYFKIGYIHEFDHIWPYFGNDFWMYDIEGNDWFEMAPFEGMNLAGKVGFTANNKGYLMLGHSYSARVNRAITNVYEYTPGLQ